MIIIDGIRYNVPVTSIKRKAEFLDKHTARNENGDLLRELVGVYFNYEITFGNTTDTTEYARLWNILTEPVEFHNVTVPDESGDYTFVAHFSNVGDEVRKVQNAKNFFKSLTVDFTAKSPARK